MTATLVVHDPRGYAPVVTGKTLAPRLASLDAKRIALVDCLFDNSEVFMQQLKAWFAEHLPAVHTEIYKPRESWEDDPAMRARVEREADAAILGVGL